jgi:hypothetical protein
MLFALRHDPHTQKQAEQDEGCKRKQNGVAADEIFYVHGAPLCFLQQHGLALQNAQHLLKNKAAHVVPGRTENSNMLDRCCRARATDSGIEGFIAQPKGTIKINRNRG